MTLLLTDFPVVFVRVLALVHGLVWGSFLNVVIHRLPRGMNLARPPSHCPRCEKPIPFYRNVPLVSWFLQRGRAACCGTRISPRYPLVELCGGILSLAVVDAIVLPLPPETSAGHALAVYLAHLALVLGLLAAAFIDIEHMIVPDSISIGGTALGIAVCTWRDLSLFEAAVGAALGFAIVWLPFDVLYTRLRGRPGMGLGDAKLLALAGAWLGWQGALLVLGAAAVQGVLFVIALVASGKQLEEPEAVRLERQEITAAIAALPDDERAEMEAELAKDPLAFEPEAGLGKARMAFGPFLILATLECLLIGRDTLLSWLLLGDIG